VNLRSRLVVLVLATVLPLVAFATIVVTLFTRHERAAIERGAIETARALVAAVDLELMASVAALQALARSRQLPARDLIAFRESATRVRDVQSHWVGVILAAPTGEQLMNLLVTPGDPLPATADMRSFTEVVRTGRPSVGDLTVGSGGRSFFAVRVPVSLDGQLRYVLSAVVEPAAIQEILAGQRLAGDWVGSILDRNHVHVARNRAHEEFFGKPASIDLRNALTRAGEGSYWGRTLEGLEVYAAFSRSEWSGWSVAFGIPAAEVVAPLRRSLLMLTAGGVFFVVLGVGLALVLGRRIARPIDSLAASAEALGRGEPLPPRQASGLQEVETLSHAIEAAGRARREAEQRLQETSETLRAIVESSALGIVVTDLEANVRIWNPAAEAMLGWTEKEVIGRPPPHVAEDLEEFQKNFAPVLHGQVVRVEVRRRRKDATEIDLSVAAAPLRDAAGQTRGVVTVFADVTERKLAEEAREESEKLVRAVLEGSDDAVYLKDSAGRYLVANPAGCRAIGRPLEEILGRTDAELLPAGAAAEIQAHDRLVMETGEAHRFEMTLTVSGVTRTYLSTKSPRRDPDGRLVGVISISRDITDRKRSEQEREELLAREQAARAAAEHASRAKDEFLAMLGHELRNPLGAIGSAVAALERVARPDDGSAPLRAILARQSRHLTRILDDLLDVSRVISGKIVLRRGPVDLREIVDGCVATLRHAGRTGAHALTVAGDPAFVEGDATRLEQVVSNLLDNALKYTPAGGAIAVTLSVEDADAVVRVRDSGIGIAPDTLPYVFDVFVQGHRSLDRPEGGLGLGLPLVKRLVELHGGRVGVASAGSGRGSEFEVRLPRLTAPPAPAPAAAPAVPGQPRRVALVEDHADARAGLRALLELWGHQVEEAEDGERGLALLRTWVADVALIDLGLPGLDGYALARAARAEAGGRKIVLVALTGYGQPEDRRRVEAAGFDAHLVKPVDPDALQRLLA
jgi:PAS domain S-box-containing protein